MMTTRDPDPDTLAPTEPGNPYPDETISLNAMPEECPLLILPYGLLSEKILHLVKEKRREKRERRIDFLIKETLNVNLTQCFERIYHLGKLDPRNSIIPIIRKSRELRSKRTMRKLVNDYEIPAIYLEEMYQRQLQGPKIETGDWIKFNNNGVTEWGVVNYPFGKSRLDVSLVKSRVIGSYYGEPCPQFHQWKRDRNKHVIKKELSAWKCEKVGHDTIEWRKLRKKCIVDYNANIRKRLEIWKNKLEPIINQLEADRIKSFKKIWYTMSINFLDKEVWKSIKKNDNDIRQYATMLLMDNSYLLINHVWRWRPSSSVERLKEIVLENGVLDD
jgi:hypothetical protein